MTIQKTNLKQHFIIFLKVFLPLGIAFLLSSWLMPLTGSSLNTAIIFLLAVVIIARITPGYFWGIFACFSSMICIICFFTYLFPSMEFAYSEYLFTFIGMLCISILLSAMTIQTDKQSTVFRERAQKTRKLNQMNNQLLTVNGLDQIIDLGLTAVAEFTGSSAIMYIGDPQNEGISTIKNTNPDHVKVMNSSHEIFLAHWTYKNQKIGGLGSNFSAKASCTYLPLISHGKSIGVLGFYPGNQHLPKENDITFLNLIITQLVMAMERQELADKQQMITLEGEKEKMRGNLLRAVSHDLRTPLTGMIGASSTLLKDREYLKEEDKVKLISNIYNDANWLLHMVENLLSVTRINEENATVTKKPEPLEEVVAEAVMRCKKRYPNARIQVSIPEELLLVPMEATLIEQVILNLLENAIKYSNSKNPIDLLVKKENDRVIFSVADDGVGLDEDKTQKIFDGITRNESSSSDSLKGMGIGLSICKTIILAHNGTITAKNNDKGGATFTFHLPLEGG